MDQQLQLLELIGECYAAVIIGSLIMAAIIIPVLFGTNALEDPSDPIPVPEPDQETPI